MRTFIHTLSALPFSGESGVAKFLSPKATKTLLALQQGYLDKVNGLASQMPERSIYQIVEKTCREPHNALLYFNASQAWNMDFFLQGLSPTLAQPIDGLVVQIERDFGSLEKLQELFSINALSMVGSGWTWLVQSPQGRLKIVNTFNGATPMFSLRYGDPAAPLSFANIFDSNSNSSISSPKTPSEPKGTKQKGNTPVLGLNMWEHAYIIDYGLDRERYVKNFWKTINWNRVAVIMNLF